ncbi:odorant receptor 131-2-like [Colossoma macropomum]|uniref:odorant receptor 131-2-like n=1 Tax=Colossoma macropomum TaxID=42526 RepID=UPI0018642966|nr:odorant receptor 131-2-like [Colossoma macropomum]
MQSFVVNSSSSNNLLTESSSSLFMKLTLVQVLVGIFLCVNCLMIFTFLKKEVFREDTRYILFAQTLFVDSTLLILSDMLMVGTAYQYHIHMIPCMIVLSVATIFTVCTPLTLVAMCLERYVAICMPLRHADISTRRNRFFGFLIIWGISSIVPLITLIAYLFVVPPGALFSYTVCNAEFMMGEEWQAHTRGTVLQLIFLFMIFIIVFTYIKIMIAARAASSENKKSTSKSLRTVLLHAFQLFLCIVQFSIPYIEMAFWNIDIITFNNIRYSNLILFVIAPRCLSPLIYGLRDEKFFLALRHNAMCGLTAFSQHYSVNGK